MVDVMKMKGHVFQYYPPLSRVRQYVEEHFAEDLSLDRVAKIANLEKKYFSTFFHRKVGITYTFWLSWFRITKAIELMRQSDESITNIAYSVGFSDLRTFERTFKKVTSLNPMEFKKSIRPS